MAQERAEQPRMVQPAARRPIPRGVFLRAEGKAARRRKDEFRRHELEANLFRVVLLRAWRRVFDRIDARSEHLVFPFRL